MLLELCYQIWMFECSSVFNYLSRIKKRERKAIWGLAETSHTKYERINYFQVGPWRSWKDLWKTFQTVIINQNSDHWRITIKAWFRVHLNLVFPFLWLFFVCHLTPYKWFSPLQGRCLMFPIAVEWRTKSKNGSTSQTCSDWGGRTSCWWWALSSGMCC